MLPVIYADNIEKATSGTVVVKTQSKRTVDEADDDDSIVLCHKSCLWEIDKSHNETDKMSIIFSEMILLLLFLSSSCCNQPRPTYLVE